MVISNLKTCYCEASKDIIIEFKSQALHNIGFKYKKASGSDQAWEWQLSLPHSCSMEDCHFRSKNRIVCTFELNFKTSLVDTLVAHYVQCAAAVLGQHGNRVQA